MKNKNWLFAGFVLALGLVVMFSFKKEDFAPNQYYEYTYTKDTITNAANDTLYLPSTFRPQLSDFQMCVSVTRTNISGTTNLAVKVEDTAYKYTGSTPPSAGWAATLNSAFSGSGNGCNDGHYRKLEHSAHLRNEYKDYSGWHGNAKFLIRYPGSLEKERVKLRRGVFSWGAGYCARPLFILK